MFLEVTTVVLLGFNTVILSVLAYKLFRKPVSKAIPKPPSDEEDDELEKKKRILKEQHDAFEKLMNYNADVAYGIGRKE